MLENSSATAALEETDALPAADPAPQLSVIKPEPAANDEDFGIEIPETPDIFNDTGKSKSGALKDKEFYLNIAAGEMTLGGGGALYQQSSEERQKQSEEQFLDHVAELFAMADRAKKWDAQMHDIGGQQYSGSELMQLRNWLQSEQNQEEFENELMQKEGITKEEARKRRKEMQELLDLKAKEKECNGKLSSGDRDRLDKLNTEQAGQDAAVVQSQIEKKGYRADLSLSKIDENDFAKSTANFMKDDGVAKASTNSSWISSENPIKTGGIKDIYNARATGMPEPAVTDTPVYQKQAKIENAVQVSGNGLG